MADAPPPHVLFVDDEAALRALMAERLRDRGYEVVEAESGEKALNMLEQFGMRQDDPQLVVQLVEQPAHLGTRLDRFRRGVVKVRR